MRWIFHGILATASAAALLAASPAAAQDLCPPHPNPSAGGCTLAFNNSTLREADTNLDGQPDNRGSPGSFCGGDSVADCCVGFVAAEVGFDLIITDPATQTVTCSSPGVDIWIMRSGCFSCLASGFGSATLPAGATTDPTIEVVVADVNGDVCPCGPTVTCTFSKEVECTDGADGDGDGLIDGADPDCCVDADGDGFCGGADCDDGDSLVHEPPDVVCDVRLSIGSAGNTRVNWIEQPGAVVDGITGLLSGLNGSYDLATCQFNNVPSSVYVDLRADPPGGDGYFFLMRAQNACGASTYSRGPALDFTGPCP